MNILKDVPLKSILHLFIVKGSVYLFPFITLPIISRSFDVAQFGIFSLFLAAQQYLIMIVEYGFTLTGSRDIARLSMKSEEGKVLNEIVMCRIIIFLLCIPIMAVAYFSLQDYGYLGGYVIIFITVMSATLNQTHYFIGKENTGFIVIVSSLTRVLSISIVVINVRSGSDFYIAMLAHSINIALPNVLSFIYVYGYSKHGLIGVPTKTNILYRFSSSWDIFISNVFTNVYGTLTLIYLGMAKGAIEVGYYSSAEKLKAAAQGALSPIAQAFFPRIAKKSGLEFHRLWLKSTIFLVGISIFLVILLLVFGEQVYKILLGSDFHSGIYIYYVLMLSIISISLGVAYGQNLYLVQGHTKLLRSIYISVSLLHIIYMPVLVHLFNGLGAALSVLLTESFASLLMFYFRKKTIIGGSN